MKFVAFHLMPYRDLPADFEFKYPSVWVTPPKKLYDPKKGHRMYHDYLEELEFAIDLGYDGIGVNEHHSNAYGLMPSPNLMGAILSRKIKDSKTSNLVVLGNSIAAYNPPIRVAEEMAMLDVLTGGKFIAGFPTGTSMDINYAYGVNPAELRERYYEAHDIIVKCWQSEEIFMWNGKYHQFRYVNPWPRPYQRPHPPVWIPGGGSIETYEFAIKNNYSFSYLSYYGHKSAKRVMDLFWEKNDELGADRNPYKAGYCQFICVSETDERAKVEYEEHVMYFYRKCMHIDPRIAEAPGYRTIPSLRKGLRSQFDGTHKRPQAQLRSGEMKWEDLLNEGYVIAGSPQTVRDQLKEVVKEIYVGNLICLLHMGSMPHWLAMKNMQLFAEEVIPYVRDVHSEWDPTPYWPKIAQEEKIEEKVN